MHKTKQEAIAHVQIILNINQRNINAMTKVSSIISMNYLCLRYIMSYLSSQRFPEKFHGQEQLKPSYDKRQVPLFLHGEPAHDASEILMTVNGM